MSSVITYYGNTLQLLTGTILDGNRIGINNVPNDKVYFDGIDVSIQENFLIDK